MNHLLKNVLERTGWDELYEQYIPGLGQPNSRGERRARSPFPDVSDRNPSFSVNVVNGLWRCWNSNRAGDYVTFRGIMDATEFDESGIAIVDYSRVERRLLVEFEAVNPIDLGWVGSCRDLLNRDLALRSMVSNSKPWNSNTLYNLNVGYDIEKDRIVIPVQDSDGHTINCRMYRPGGEPKMFWANEGLGGNFLFPHSAWQERSLILVEGEPDAISLRSYGFAACSGTLGAGNPVPEGNWYWHKTVFIWMDADTSGQEASNAAAAIIREHAADVRIIELPMWDGRPEKADVSDYIMHLLSIGYEFEQVQRAISQVIESAIVVDSPSASLDMEAVETSFYNALSADRIGQRVSFVSRVSAKSSSKMILPTVYSITCPSSGHNYCNRCPMSHTFHGNGRFIHDARTVETLKMIQTSDSKQLEIYKTVNGIPQKCPSCVVTVQTAVNIEMAMLNATIKESDEYEINDHSRREAYVIIGDEPLIENTDYRFEGFVYAHPSTQQAVFLLDAYTPFQSKYETFQMVPKTFDELRQFSPNAGQTVYEKLLSVAEDTSMSTTMIYGRQELHLAYRTVWHSCLKFNLRGYPINRGWIECLVIGDTRCGKSAAFKRMAEMYGVGVMIDCKAQTLAGILGSVVQSSSGEYYVVAGLLPQQDGGVVCFDEFHVPKSMGFGLIDNLSSTRSEGIVKITKAAQAEFRARVRSIWLANPGAGKLMAELPHNGVELINRLITQPEDIARFDLALALSQSDVPAEVINEGKSPQVSQYGNKLHQELIAWTYSRKPEQIVFMEKAESLVFEIAMRMCRRYDSSIPLVEIADQRNRVAKVAVSIAAQCFSTDNEGNYLIVCPEHVETAEMLFHLWYNSASMGYNVYSDTTGSSREIIDKKSIIQVLNNYGADAFRLAEELLRLDEFPNNVLEVIVPNTNLMATTNSFQTLSANRCVQYCDRGVRGNFEKTPAFTALLKEYLSKQK